jgi:hypothetical protein
MAVAPHPDLPPPRSRRVLPSDARPGRAGVYDLRRASNLPLGARVERQVERDALVHRLRQLDDQLVRVSEERQAVVHALAELRDVLYPPVPWAKGRRPPDIDRAPLPAAPQGSQPLRARDLRATCLAILRRHGRLALPELHGLVHRYGYLVGAARPVQALADAMAYEVERGRARRPERGVYEPVPGHDPPTGRSPLDRDLDEDPRTWADHPASEDTLEELIARSRPVGDDGAPRGPTILPPETAVGNLLGHAHA